MDLLGTSFGISNFEELLEFAPSLSLLIQVILDGPCVPMLLVNIKDDDSLNDPAPGSPPK